MFANTSQLLPDELGRWASHAVIAALLLFVLYQTGYAIYNLYFHPLSKFPGPRLWAISRIPYVLAIRKGRFVYRVKEFHDRYNSHVIRVAPDELTFTDGSVWKDAYQFRQGQKDFPKHSVWLRPMVNGAWSILHADDVTHARIKRLLGHAFSTKALRGQEEFVHQYTSLLVRKLKESIEAGQNIVDIVKWYNFTVFDIIGDLTYGEPFGCLKDGKNHPFVSKLFQQFKGATTLGTTRYFPGFEKLMYWVVPKSVVAMRWELFRRTQEKIQRRIDMQTDRLDLMHYVQRHNDEKGMSRDEIDATLTTLTIAGGETTNTFLAGTTYFLIQNPKVWEKLSTEIRGAFKSEDEINDLELEKLPYFGAVIKEGLRLVPPLASGHPRIVPPGGRTVAGHWLPEGTVVHVVAWAASRSPLNFADPDKFDPERWLHHNGYDDVSAFQPFSVGSRGCIARNLAMLSLRLIMAWMIWNFDISVPGGGTEVPWEWSSQNVFLVWEKRPLFVELKVAKH